MKLQLWANLYSTRELEQVLDTADTLEIKYIPGHIDGRRVFTFPTLEIDSTESKAFLDLCDYAMLFN